MYSPNSPEAKLGEWAQAQADKILKEEGYRTIPLHLARQVGAALFSGNRENIPAMDSLDIRGGKSALRDVKGKTQSTFRRRYSLYSDGTNAAGQQEHGIDKACWDNYGKQCKEAGIEGYIAVVELNQEIQPDRLVPSGKLFLYKMEGLPHRHSLQGTYGKGGMVYWPRNSFDSVYPLNGSPNGHQ